MPGTLRSVRSLLLSVAILLTGHGLQLTLLPLKAYELGWDSSAIGLTGSAYYVGFIIGCLMIPGIIRRVGHIRAFAVMVATASMVVLAASVLESYAVWLALRLFTGWSMASLYTVIESWLNDRADNTRRGAVLGVYTMISLVALTLGQLFIELERLTLDELFPIAGLLIIGATIPVALTSRTQPGVPAAFEFNWRTVYDASHVGVVSAGISGLVMGLIWSVGAVYAAEVTGQVESGARFVTSVILGGLLLQFPLGRVSDRLDRRWIILGLGVLGAVGSSVWIFRSLDGMLLYVSGFLCGGAAMPMYSISIAHANDNAEGRFLQIASGMLMANALGAVIGPFAFGASRYLGASQGFMATLGVAFLCCVVWTGVRLKAHSARRDYFEPFQPLPKTSPEVAVLDPRMEGEPVSELEDGGPA
jgi:MFS family permease